MSHWTYTDEKPEDLFQGDIIARSEPLLKVFQSVHRHFCDEKYLAFLVITQTCDLVRHGRKPCKAKHINLAVIRAFDDLVPDFFNEIAGTDYDGIYLEESKEEAKRFLTRVIHQNEQAHGIFYLHPDADVQIAVPAVALLRVSIALRAREHYEILLKERCGQLATAFRNKLGWLAGNLYSRVDTPDWSDHEGGDSQSKQAIKSFLDGAESEKPNAWVKASWIKEAKKHKLDIAAIPRGEVYQELQKFEPSAPIPIVLERIKVIESQVLLQIRNNDPDKVVDYVAENAAYRVLMAEHVFRVVLKISNALLAASLFAQLEDLPTFNDAIPVAIKNAVNLYKGHRGQKDQTTLLNFFRQSHIFPPEFILEILGAIELPQEVDAESLDAKLREEKPTLAMVELVRTIMLDVTQPNLIDGILKRLENDRDFNDVFRRMR